MSPRLGMLGRIKLYLDEKIVAEGPCRTQSGHYALCGEGLCIGYDSGDAVSSEYKGRFPFSGGRIIKVVYDVARDVCVDVERQMAAAMARD
jgi:arylsulfatase